MDDGAFAIGALWRSTANLRYTSRPSSGIGSVLERYVPDRPQSRIVAAHYQRYLSRATFHANVEIDQTLWSSASSGKSAQDYVGAGIGFELLFPSVIDGVLAFRGGIRRADPQGAGDSPEITLLTIGIGYGFNAHHFVDMAVERRDLASIGDGYLVALSYSLQN
jgi:hypothetical protein